MSVSQALSEGLQTTVVGLAIVFSVLIILMAVLSLMKVIFYKDPKKAQEAKKVAEEVKTAAPVVEEKKNVVNEEELIAVLTAAVAASLNTSTYNLQIKSYRRVDNAKSAWNKAGLRETINNRF